ncbi:MAG: hypothetical protein VX498_11225 [Myxococcota bacterium]|nr:hypothetical protein [Myxococcota bacterium]
MRSLDRIQRHLEAIYDLGLDERVGDFLIDEDGLETLVASGLLGPECRGTEEQVLVLPDEEGFSIGVYLSEAVQRSMRAGEHRLQVHCHATEAVSHFVMLLWAAREGRQVRLFELELQAEVDKVVTALLEDLRHSGGRGADRLIRGLFAGAELAEHLDPVARSRYRESHRLVRDYSPHLSALLDSGVDRLLSELRRLYRLPCEGKLQHIARAA